MYIVIVPTAGAVAAVGGRQLIVDDPREEVTDVTYPFSAVGAILGSKSEVVGSYTCSGALIAPDLVLTAGRGGVSMTLPLSNNWLA